MDVNKLKRNEILLIDARTQSVESTRKQLTDGNCGDYMIIQDNDWNKYVVITDLGLKILKSINNDCTFFALKRLTSGDVYRTQPETTSNEGTSIGSRIMATNVSNNSSCMNSRLVMMACRLETLIKLLDGVIEKMKNSNLLCIKEGLEFELDNSNSICKYLSPESKFFMEMCERYENSYLPEFKAQVINSRHVVLTAISLAVLAHDFIRQCMNVFSKREVNAPFGRTFKCDLGIVRDFKVNCISDLRDRVVNVMEELDCQAQKIGKFVRGGTEFTPPTTPNAMDAEEL